MIRQKLRRYDPREGGLSKYKAWMASCGQAVTQSVPPPGAVLHRFSTLSGYSILIDLRVWFAQYHPECSQLALEYMSDKDLRNFFSYGDSYCEMSLPDGERLCFDSNAPETNTDVSYTLMPDITTSLGSGWLVAVAEDIKPVWARFEPKHLSFCLRLLLGESYLRLRYLKKLKPGDVLIISQFREEVLVGDYRLGKFHCQEEKFVFEEEMDDFEEEMNDFEQEMDDFEEEMDDFEENSDSLIAGEPHLAQQDAGLSKLPIKLSFIVHEKKVTLADLRQLSSGDVFSTGVHGRNSVTICANNILIGRGELVWIEESLCVEVQTLIDGAIDGK